MRPLNTDRLYAGLKSRLVRLGSESGGNVAMMFGMSMFAIVAASAAAIDLAQTNQFKRQLSQAADSVALAAASSVGQGASIASATTEGQSLWQANTANVQGSFGSPAIAISSSAGIVNATVNYSGCVPTTFGQVIGITQLCASGASAAQVGQSTTVTYSGSGEVWGDPHSDGADGSHNTFMCPGATNWYNLLSDSGIEVNVNCAPWVNNVDYMDALTVMLGSHVIQIVQGPLDSNGVPVAPYWFGQVTIDGTTYNPGLGSTNYLNGAVTANIGELSNPANQAVDNITITTPQYTIVIFFSGGVGYVTITATNVGGCEKPGGIWGQTLSANGNEDMNSADFLMPSETATGQEFGRSACALAGKYVRLTQ